MGHDLKKKFNFFIFFFCFFDKSEACISFHLAFLFIIILYCIVLYCIVGYCIVLYCILYCIIFIFIEICHATY